MQTLANMNGIIYISDSLQNLILLMINLSSLKEQEDEESPLLKFCNIKIIDKNVI